MDTFNFDDWANASQLNRDTVKALRTHKMTDYICLTNIKSGEIKRAGLALGQEIYFRMALATLGNPNFKEDVPVSVPAAPTVAASSMDQSKDQETDPDLDQERGQEPNKEPDQEQEENILLAAGAQLDALFKNSPDVTRALSAPAQPEVTSLLSAPAKLAPLSAAYDPRILLSAKATKKKAEKITSFLPERVKDRIQRARKDRMILTQGEDGSISVKANDKESYYISMSEWGAANMRLMNYLLQNGDLPRDHVEYYLAYTMQVFELADNFEWASVLQFDSRYRDLQAEHGFPWGDMRLSQQMQVLRPKTLHSVRPRPVTGKPPKIEEDCKKWLATNGKCPFGTSCKFIHKKLDPPAKND